MFYDSLRGQIFLGDLVGRGGEAEVYTIRGQPGWLGKIYLGSLRPNYSRKLTWMRDHPPDNPTRSQGHASLAWPVDLIFDERRQVRGYLMPHIGNAVPLLEVFNPRRRSQVLPEFDWPYLHRAARNLAAALDAIHTRGYIVGDLNESNVLVTPAALITLIDTDSFQVRETDGAKSIMTHRCPVAKPEYTPPELQGRSLERMLRSPEHDLFGLGVLIFQLLMDGNHPFRAQWLGQGDPLPLPERIRRGCFPYLKAPPCPVAPPPGAPGLDLLHPDLAELVRLCFIAGGRDPRQRPSPERWEEAIREAEEGLVLCPNGHYFSGHLKRCPHCPSMRLQIPLPPAGVLFRGFRRKPAPLRPSTPQASGAAAAVLPLPRAPIIAPAPVRGAAQGVRAEFFEVLKIGIGVGGLAGAMLGALVAALPMAVGKPAGWQLIWAVGAAGGGLGRGWQFGLGIGRGIGSKFGWNRAWQAIGAAAGSVGAGLLAWNLTGGFAATALGVMAGLITGRFLGQLVWSLGDRVGWEQIWTVTGALGGGWLGWVLGHALGGTFLGIFGGELVVWIVGRSIGPGLAWALVGAMSGAVGGALAGIGVELVARLLGVAR